MMTTLNGTMKMPNPFYEDIVTHSQAFYRGEIDEKGNQIACVELPERYESVPTRWRNQAEVVEIQEAIEDLIGTTYETDKAARALLNQTQNPGKLRQVLNEFKRDQNFCQWVRGKGLRAFAFKSMVLTRYYEKKRDGYSLGKPWRDEIDPYVNR